MRAPRTKLVPWEVIKATGGVVFVERKGIRFAFHNDGEGETKRLAALLNRKDREIDRLEAQLVDLQERS